MSGDFSYIVKFQKRKTLSLYVLTDGSVEVRAPLRTSEASIVRFVEARAQWVLKTRAQQLQRLRWQNPVAPGAPQWLLGQPLTLLVERAPAFTVNREGDTLRVGARNPDDWQLLARELERWYRAQAQVLFEQRLPLACRRFPGELAAPELRLRRMRRRWGSCTRGGRVTLNTELVKLPLDVIDYVIVHELCHLFEFNHSPRFYQLLARVMPDWKQRETLLRQF